jgi:uncharacterized membrane protein
VGSAYAVSWGLQTALAFDFHEVSLGVPLMAAAASAYLEARWRSAYLWTASLLLVKEDLALTVAAFGVYLCLQRRVRAGITMVAGAIAWAALVVWVLVPAFSPYGRYTYWSSLDQPPSPIRPQETALDWSSLVFNGTKWHTLLLLLVVVVFLPLLSPLTIAVLPTIGWRFLSGNSAYWGTRYHYSEILMPLLFIAAVDGVLRLRRWLRGRAPDTWVRRGAAVGMLGVSIALLPSFPFWQATESFFWQRCPRCADAELAVKAIPDDASVAADTLLMPELVDRTDVYLISPDFRDPTGRTFSVQYVLLDEAHRNLWPQPDWIGVLRQHLQERDFREVARHGDYVVYQR